MGWAHDVEESAASRNMRMRANGGTWRGCHEHETKRKQNAPMLHE